MALKQVVPGLYEISLGFVNAFLLAGADGLTLIDTGIGSSAPRIMAAVAELGKSPHDVRRIVLTHLHGDHVGSLAALKRLTGASAYMHPADAALVRRGIASRPTVAGPGLLGHLMHAAMALRPAATIEPVEIEHTLNDGGEVPGTGGLCALATPGHTAGHLALLWPHDGGVMILGDAAARWMGRLSPAPIFEDMDEGMRSLRKIARQEFDAAVFGHGPAITAGASAQFRQRWPQ
jgi:glyoxylase-like metal-dependent hydrolase (beta-lactamase superfamily II)